MPTSSIDMTPGNGTKKLATHSISEDGVTKELGRYVLEDSSGTEISPATETTLAAIQTALGEVQASPTNNTVLDRLKDLLTGISLAAGTNLIGNVGHGKTLKSVTGTVSADTDIVAAVTAKRIKVVSLSLLTSSTTAVTVTLQSGATTALATYPLQAISGGVSGISQSIPAPSFLFATVAGEKLTLDVSAAQSVAYNLTYFDDDAA